MSPSPTISSLLIEASRMGALVAPPRPASYDEKVALVLQGGGALGSYQAGVYEALSTADYPPDWVAGISIGAVNAAIIAGNPPERRVARLRQFWEGITAPPAWWPAWLNATLGAGWGDHRKAAAADKLPEALRVTPEAQFLYAFGCVTTMDIVGLIDRASEVQGHAKDYEFSRRTMEARWARGRADAETTLRASPSLAPMPPELGARTFDVLTEARKAAAADSASSRTTRAAARIG